MTEYLFTTPSVEEGPAGGGRLFHFYKLSRGITVVRERGEYKLIRYPVDEDLAKYQEVYLGGSNHRVSQETKDAMIAANIGIEESNFTIL
jgi:hypothetical protein